MAELKHNLERKKNEIGLVGTRLNFSRPKEGRGISEHITHDWSEIVIRLRQDLDLAPDSATKNYLEKVRVVDPVETVATDILYHGCGHRELPTETGLGCPYTVENHDRILNGVARALKEKGKVGLEGYVANAFEDVLDNTNTRRHTRHAGQILFWNNEGLENQNKFGDFYEAFVRINLGLWGCAEDATLLRRFYSDSDKVKKAIGEFSNYLKGVLKTKHLVKTHSKEGSFRRLFNKVGWEDMAYRFALATADLLDSSDKKRLCMGEADGGSPFDKMMKVPGTQEDLAYGRYKAGDSPSVHTDPLLQLDSLYRKISRAVPVQTSEYTKAASIPIARFGRRSIRDDEDVKVNRIKGIGFDEDGELTFKVSRHEIHHPATYKVHPRKFPKLKVSLLDTSGSMANSPNEDNNVGNTAFIPWGDNSKYHYALQGLYGIDNFLEKQGVAPYVESEAIVFSGSTVSSGRRKFRSEEERRLLLRKPSGGTTIDTKLLDAELGEKCFLISVSDGDIQSWDTVKEDYKMAVEGNDYCHIHIGSPNAFTKDLESWGVSVHYVKGNEDLSKIMINAASKYYREGSAAK